MHPVILALAKHFGTKIENRNCFENHIFDGKSIAMFGSIWFQDGDGECVRKPIEFSDHDLLHEICHFVVAAPEQRDLPEYGVGNPHECGEVNTPAVVGEWRDEDWGFNWNNEGQIQEGMAQFLSVLWGTHYDISSRLSREEVFFAPDWNAYLDCKIAEAIKINHIEFAWEALFRLEKMGLLNSFPI
jgi:hypothetical protein